MESIDKSRERRPDVSESEVCLSQIHMGFFLLQFGPGDRQLGLRDNLCVGQSFGVVVLHLCNLGLRLRSPQFCLINQGEDLEHGIPLFDCLPFGDRHAFQITPFQSPDFDIAGRTDLTNEVAGHHRVLPHGTRDHKFRLFLLLFMLVALLRFMASAEQKGGCNASAQKRYPAARSSQFHPETTLAGPTSPPVSPPQGVLAPVQGGLCHTLSLA